MTREDQIEQEWFRKACLSTHCYDEKSFKEGAKWADKTMIEKACKWLEDNLFDHSPDKEVIDIEWSTSIISNLIVCDYFNSIDECINDFKKAMEE